MTWIKSKRDPDSPFRRRCESRGRRRTAANGVGSAEALAPRRYDVGLCLRVMPGTREKSGLGVDRARKAGLGKRTRPKVEPDVTFV